MKSLEINTYKLPFTIPLKNSSTEWIKIIKIWADLLLLSFVYPAGLFTVFQPKNILTTYSALWISMELAAASPK